MRMRVAPSELAVYGAGAMTTRPKDGTPVMEARVNSENPREGYIKLFRSILKHPLFEDHPPEYLKIWIYLLCKATRKPRRWWDGGQEVDLPVGSYVSSLSKIAETLKLSRGVVERAVNVMQKSSMLTVVPRHKRTMYVIANYNAYQSYTGETETQTSSTQADDRDANRTQTGRKQDANGRQTGGTINKREEVRGNPGEVIAAGAGARGTGQCQQQHPTVAEFATVPEPDPVRAGKVWPPLAAQANGTEPEDYRKITGRLPEPDQPDHDRQALAWNLVEELWPRHPGRGGKPQAIQELSFLIANPDPATDELRRWTEDPVATCDAIRRGHAQFLADIASGRGNQYQLRIPLARWIGEGDWQARVGIETVDERVQRTIREVLHRKVAG